MCGSKEYSVLDYHTEKEHAIVIDSIKCVDCGKVFKLTEAKVGVNYPPLHPRRSLYNNWTL